VESPINTIRPYRKNNRFYNTVEHYSESFWFGTIPSFVRSFLKRKKHTQSEIQAWLHHEAPVSLSDIPRVTWLGHATFLIQIGGVNILTDPVFGNLSFLFPRILPNTISPDNLPRIDVILISHNHRDHMDADSLCMLKSRWSNAQILVPWGDKAWFDVRGFAHVYEHMWWDERNVSSQVVHNSAINFTFLPAWHWSQRGIFDKNKSLWGSWMIEHNGYHIYFAGDTAYATHFKAIAQKFNSINLALMPIGPCEPRPWMKHSHIDAYEACNAFLELNAQAFIPMHWGTFAFGEDYFELPIQRLKDAWSARSELALKKLIMPKVGQALEFENIPLYISQVNSVHLSVE
jgi:L-ascorbate metabolism protein UlaG (beta-lactamase superfamily)